MNEIRSLNFQITGKVTVTGEPNQEAYVKDIAQQFVDYLNGRKQTAPVAVEFSHNTIFQNFGHSIQFSLQENGILYDIIKKNDQWVVSTSCP